MDYISPSEVAEIFVTSGASKSRISIGQLPILRLRRKPDKAQA